MQRVAAPLVHFKVEMATRGTVQMRLTADDSVDREIDAAPRAVVAQTFGNQLCAVRRRVVRHKLAELALEQTGAELHEAERPNLRRVGVDLVYTRAHSFGQATMSRNCCGSGTMSCSTMKNSSPSVHKRETRRK